MRCCPAPRARRKTLTPARSAPALARRYANVYEMDETARGNELQHKVLEYCIHGHAIRAEDDVKGLDGAWWVPLRKLVGDIGQEATEEALEAFEATLIKDRKERLEQVLAGNSSEDDREDDDI